MGRRRKAKLRTDFRLVSGGLGRRISHKEEKQPQRASESEGEAGSAPAEVESQWAGPRVIGQGSEGKVVWHPMRK